MISLQQYTEEGVPVSRIWSESVCFNRVNELLRNEDMRNPVGENEYCFIGSDSDTGSQTV